MDLLKHLAELRREGLALGGTELRVVLEEAVEAHLPAPPEVRVHIVKVGGIVADGDWSARLAERIEGIVVVAQPADAHTAPRRDLARGGQLTAGEEEQPEEVRDAVAAALAPAVPVLEGGRGHDPGVRHVRIDLIGELPQQPGGIGQVPDLALIRVRERREGVEGERRARVPLEEVGEAAVDRAKDPLHDRPVFRLAGRTKEVLAAEGGQEGRGVLRAEFRPVVRHDGARKVAMAAAAFPDDGLDRGMRGRLEADIHGEDEARVGIDHHGQPAAAQGQTGEGVHELAVDRGVVDVGEHEGRIAVVGVAVDERSHGGAMGLGLARALRAQGVREGRALVPAQTEGLPGGRLDGLARGHTPLAAPATEEDIAIGHAGVGVTLQLPQHGLDHPINRLRQLATGPAAGGVIRQEGLSSAQAKGVVLAIDPEKLDLMRADAVVHATGRREVIGEADQVGDLGEAPVGRLELRRGGLPERLGGEGLAGGQRLLQSGCALGHAGEDLGNAEGARAAIGSVRDDVADGRVGDMVGGAVHSERAARDEVEVGRDHWRQRSLEIPQLGSAVKPQAVRLQEERLSQIGVQLAQLEQGAEHLLGAGGLPAHELRVADARGGVHDGDDGGEQRAGDRAGRSLVEVLEVADPGRGDGFGADRIEGQPLRGGPPAGGGAVDGVPVRGERVETGLPLHEPPPGAVVADHDPAGAVAAHHEMGGGHVELGGVGIVLGGVRDDERVGKRHDRDHVGVVKDVDQVGAVVFARLERERHLHEAVRQVATHAMDGGVRGREVGLEEAEHQRGGLGCEAEGGQVIGDAANDRSGQLMKVLGLRDSELHVDGSMVDVGVIKEVLRCLGEAVGVQDRLSRDGRVGILLGCI